MSTLQLSQADNSKLITLSQGDILSIELPENPTTGFRWEIDQAADRSEQAIDIITLESSRFVSAGGGSGGGGDRTFILKAARAGTAQIVLKLWQPWEGESSIIDRFQLTLRVQN